ncbi:Hachiman antiphage defense system protein HamA [Levilactobacillus brevis]|nr:Hachiman antiphage defense system protein HamA [Levilactobacillus brevis]
MSSYAHFGSIQNIEEKNIEVIAVQAQFDNIELITDWAKSFRHKYISDEDLLEGMEDIGENEPIDFLKEMIYPENKKFKSGDFGEILVAEYLMYTENFWVPTLSLRYSEKSNKEESTKGSDIIAIRFDQDPAHESVYDLLCIGEVKTGSTSTSTIRGRLQDAINGSNKDSIQLLNAKRGSVGLNAVKLKIKHREPKENQGEYSYREIARFENPIERPYQTQYVAAAVVDQKHINQNTVKKVVTKESQHVDSLRMIAVGVSDIQKLIDALYSELGVSNLDNE